MGYTGIYSPLKSIERDTPGARIEDINGWKEWKHKDGLKGTAFRKSVTRSETLSTEYPRREYEVLYGFRTWTREDDHPDHSTSTLGCNFNLERVGYWYGNKFANFWADLSELTEPFTFYHPEPSHGIDEHAGDIIESPSKKAVKVQCEGGEIDITEFKIEAHKDE